MPRQRMVKPEFFDSESLALCSIEARLAFIGLWVTSDDYGNQKAQLTRIQHRIFPYDKIPGDAFLGYLCELEEVGCIKGYEIDGERFITVPNFTSYQTVRKPSSTTIPEPPKATVKARVTNVVRGWRNGGAPVTHQCGSDALVQHDGATSAPKERRKEGRNGVITNPISNEIGSPDGAAVAEATPPVEQDDTSVPACPLCSKRINFDAKKGKWVCPMCGDLKEPSFVPAAEVVA